MGNLADAVVVITGASSGIGRATALAFAGKGAKVVLAARRQEPLEAAALECRQAGAADALAIPTDVTNPEAVEQLAGAAVDRFGRIDVWVNNAAVTVFAPFGDLPLEDFRRVVDTDLYGQLPDESSPSVVASLKPESAPSGSLPSPVRSSASPSVSR